MSSPRSTTSRTHRIGRALFLTTALLLCGAVGCWEQWSDTWFPQMKRQKAVQAFETLGHEGRVEAFTPPEGTVSVNGGTPPMGVNDEATQNTLVNPRATSLESLENGRLQYVRYCATCHGDAGMGDGPVSMTGDIQGPLGGVLPLAGPASIVKVRSDGHLYSTIRYGRRRMPSYQRIASDDRWDIVNYLRYMNGQKGVGQ
ncbi:MAG: c-type cytochrome [Myxococcota bacterium]